MKAVAVIPRKGNSIHLRDVPEPFVADIDGGRGGLVKVLPVGGGGSTTGSSHHSVPEKNGSREGSHG